MNRLLNTSSRTGSTVVPMARWPRAAPRARARDGPAPSRARPMGSTTVVALRSAMMAGRRRSPGRGLAQHQRRVHHWAAAEEPHRASRPRRWRRRLGNKAARIRPARRPRHGLHRRPRPPGALLHQRRSAGGRRPQRPPDRRQSRRALISARRSLPSWRAHAAVRSGHAPRLDLLAATALDRGNASPLGQRGTDASPGSSGGSTAASRITLLVGRPCRRPSTASGARHARMPSIRHQARLHALAAGHRSTAACSA